MTALLTVRGLGLTRPGPFRVTLGRLGVGPGDRLAIVGPSGCGKSTILDLLAGVLRPDQADSYDLALADGAVSVAQLWARGDRAGLRRLRARHFGYVLQSGGLIPFLSLAGNVGLPLLLAGRRDPVGVAALLDRLGLAAVARRPPAQVSIGQRQRAAIARALIHRPALVLADEPTAALDPATATQVMNLLTDTATGQGTALIVVTHDRALAERHGLRVIACQPHPGGMTLTDAP